MTLSVYDLLRLRRITGQDYSDQVPLLQKEDHMVHLLYPQMKKLVQDLFIKYLDKVVKNLGEVEEMLKFNAKDKQNHSAQD